MAQIASLLVPGVNIPQSDNSWLGSIADSIGGAVQNVRADRSFNGLADRIQGGASTAPQQQSGGFLSNLIGGNRPQAQTAPVAPVYRGDLQGDTYRPFIDTVRSGGLTNPYGLAAVASTGKAESGWSAANANRTWSDPSESGKPGTAGGIMSWRGPRYQALAATGDLSPEGQARFFLQENPQLIQQLNNAKSIEEAQSLINNAWAFAGHDRPGGESARRLAMAKSYYANEFGNAPSNGGAASAIEAIAPASGYVNPGMSSQPQQAAFDMGRFGDNMNLAEMPPTRADIAPQMQRQTAGLANQPALRPFQPGERRNNADGSYSTEITTTWQLPDGSWVNAPSLWMGANGPQQFDPNDEEGILGALQQYEAQNGQSFQRYGSAQEAERAAQQRSAAGGVESAPYTMASPTAPQQVADTSGGSSTIAQGVTPVQRGSVDPSIIQYMLRDRNLREVGLKLWAANAEGQKASEPWQFVTLPDGTLARANQQTGAVERLGNFAKPAGSDNLVNAGDGRLYNPNTQEWIVAPQTGSQNFRQASPEEANRYGAQAGQFGPDGRFYPINPPQGTSLQVDPTTGAVTFNQGAGVKPLTEGQSKDAVFSTRARGALQILDPIDRALASAVDRVAGSVPVAGNYLTSEQYQKANNAGKEFLQAILRKDTGAAITKEETAEYGDVYLPRPGDSDAVIAQKRQARSRALAAIEAGMPAQAILQQEKALSVSSGTSEIPAVVSPSDYEKLPSGAQYRDPNGNIRTKR